MTMDIEDIRADLDVALKAKSKTWSFDVPTLVSMVQHVDEANQLKAQLASNAQALADSNLALMEQTELAERLRQQAETLEAELRIARAACDAQGELTQKYQALALQAAQAAPAVQVQDERAAFEAYFSQDGAWPNAVERKGDGYKLSSAQTAWTVWQARAALTKGQK